MPIVVMTSSKEEPDIAECYRLGVNSANAVVPGQADVVRILDDDLQVLAYLANVVRALNYAVDAFSDPLAFMNDETAVPPSCLIVDWQLPGHDGLIVIAQCQKRWPMTPAILVSGHVS